MSSSLFSPAATTTTGFGGASFNNNNNDDSRSNRRVATTTPTTASSMSSSTPIENPLLLRAGFTTYLSSPTMGNNNANNSIRSPRGYNNININNGNRMATTATGGGGLFPNSFVGGRGGIAEGIVGGDAVGLRQRRKQQQPSDPSSSGAINTTTNNNGKNIQQQQQQQQVGAATPPPPPPRASYSLGTVGGGASTTMSGATRLNDDATATTSYSSTLLRPSTTGCWVLVFGYATQDQYSTILQRFARYGRVLQHVGSCQPGRSNYIAIQYESNLQASKALCHKNVELGNGIYCGVKKLDDNDPIILQQQQQQNQYQQQQSGFVKLWGSSSSEQTITTNGDSKLLADRRNGVGVISSVSQGQIQYYSHNGDVVMMNGVGGQQQQQQQQQQQPRSLICVNNSGERIIDEREILLMGDESEQVLGTLRGSGRCEPNICSRVLRWLLSIED